MYLLIHGAFMSVNPLNPSSKPVNLTGEPLNETIVKPNAMDVPILQKNKEIVIEVAESALSEPLGREATLQSTFDTAFSVVDFLFT